MVWARATFGMRSFHAGANPTEGQLITSGPYRWLRHPIYASIIWFVWAGVAPHWSTDSALGALVVTLGLIVRMLLEERELRDRYPDYRTYERRTRRVIPFVI